MTIESDQANQRDLEIIQKTVFGWNLAAVPLTAALSLIFAWVGANLLVKDGELVLSAMGFLYDVLPVDDFELKTRLVLLIILVGVLAISTLIAKWIVSGLISYRLLAGINRAPHPMGIVHDMKMVMSKVPDNGMRDRFRFRPSNDVDGDANANNASHQGSFLWPLVWAIAVAFLFFYIKGRGL